MPASARPASSIDSPPVLANPSDVSDPWAAPFAPSPEPGPVVVVDAPAGTVDVVTPEVTVVLVEVLADVGVVVELVPLVDVPVVDVPVVGAADWSSLPPSEPGCATAKPMPATITRSAAAMRSLGRRNKESVGSWGVGAGLERVTGIEPA